MSDLPTPSIPLLRDDTIDLKDLEGDLATWIKYPGFAHGDEVFPVWRGCGQDSAAYDYVGEVIEVDDSNYDPEMGVAVTIRGSLLNALDQGWAMYSYSVALQGGERGPESLRQFCYVGVRPRQAGSISPTLRSTAGNAASTFRPRPSPPTWARARPSVSKCSTS